MSAMKAGPAVPNWVAAGLIGIILGGVGGFYGSRWNEKPASTGSEPGGMPGMAGPAMGGGGMGGGGGAQEHPNAAALVRTVGNLVVLEKARGHELSADQRKQVAQVTAELAKGDTLTEEQCEAHLKKLEGLLSAEQQEVLEDLTPRFGRGGGGGGRGAGSGPPGGGNGPGANGPGGNGPGAGMVSAASPGGRGGGGARTDWERPFKEGRGRDRIDELTQLLAK